MHGLPAWRFPLVSRASCKEVSLCQCGPLALAACCSSHAAVERQPKDSAFDPARGRKDLPPDAPLLRGNWLCASHVADNAQVLRAAAEQAGTEPRAALEVRAGGAYRNRRAGCAVKRLKTFNEHFVCVARCWALGLGGGLGQGQGFGEGGEHEGQWLAHATAEGRRLGQG